MKTFKLHSSISKIASKSAFKPHINKIHITPETITATNSWALIQVQGPGGKFQPYTVERQKKTVDLNTLEKKEDDFAEVDHIISQAYGREGQEITLDVDQLMTLLKGFKAQGEERVVLKTSGEMQPLVIVGQKTSGVLMPLRRDI